MNLQLPLDLCAAVHAGALMFWFGALSLRRVLALEPHPVEATALRLAGALALASGVLWPFLQTGVALDDPGAALDPVQVAVVLRQTSFGRIWLQREALVAMAVGLASFSVLESGRLVFLMVACALGSIALLGHAAGVGGSAGWGQRLVLAAHLLAAGAWLGALPLLWLSARKLPRAVLANALRRFSGYGVKLVAVVLVTGALSAWWRMGALQVMFTSGYGRILLGKVGLVLLMGIAALLNRNRFNPALDPDGTGEVRSMQPRAPQFVPEAVRERARRGLIGSIGAEMTLGVFVVLLAFILGSAEAPR